MEFYEMNFCIEVIRIAEEGNYNIYGVSLNDSIIHKIQSSNAKELLK